MNKIEQIASESDNYLLGEARLSGKKIIGHFCSYVPVEVLHAAGLVPYRMRAVGSTGTDLADGYYAPLNCSYVRHCFNKALKGTLIFSTASFS
jgi:benzoyl-CoA reductase/2-hydroxyglutaryl-CoA dehydratase subunit BcrC/BadD/HgdB